MATDCLAELIVLWYTVLASMTEKEGIIESIPFDTITLSNFVQSSQFLKLIRLELNRKYDDNKISVPFVCLSAVKTYANMIYTVS